MRELKLDGDRRLKFAKNAYEEQDRAIKKWNNYKEQEKINQCHLHPFVKVSRFYDFELGIIRNINPPRDIERREYEEKHRPPIKDQAFRMMEKMKNICKKIDDMNKEGGIADILALKWLISSVIRRETPFIDSKQFQELYSDWQKSAFVAIWASIETWALKNDFPLKLLAQDNIVYNLRLNKLFNNITLLPCIAVDLNDYTASIIKRNGKLILQIEPANITPAIENCFGGDMKLGINSLSTLHESFCTWMKTNFSLTEGLDKQIAKEKTSLLPPPVSLVQAVVLLEIAQAKLFNSGDTDATGELIKQIQRFDKGIIYFIGAITEQFQTMRIIEQKWHSLEELNANGMPDLIEHNQTRDINGMINNTIGQIIQHFRNIHLEKIKIDEIINHRALENQLDLTNQIRPELIIKAFDEIKTIPINKAIPLSSIAETYIAQLIDKEPEFIPLLYLLRDVNTLKKWSLKLSPDQEKQVIATLNGIIGLEFLEIAEGLETGASNLDLDETSLNRIDNSLSDIYAKLHNTTFEKPSCTEEIIEAINFVTKKIKTK
jgi:hypothetical protein